MWVISCKLKCPSLCFSKSSHSLQCHSPLKLEDAQHNVSHVLEEQSTEEKNGEVETIESSDEKVEIFLKSSLKKSPVSRLEKIGKGRVKWMDFIGKDLVEIREFDSMLGFLGVVRDEKTLRDFVERFERNLLVDEKLVEICRLCSAWEVAIVLGESHKQSGHVEDSAADDDGGNQTCVCVIQ